MHIPPSTEYTQNTVAMIFPDHNFDVTAFLCLITPPLISPHSAVDLFANLSDSATGICLCWQIRTANHTP